MTTRRHHYTEWEGEHVDGCACDAAPDCIGTIGPIPIWYYEDDQNPGVFLGIRGNPVLDDDASAQA